MIIAIDFDGTCVKHKYPDIGEDIGAAPVLKALQDNGVFFILHTIRDNHSCGRNCLKEAVDWFEKNGITLYGINENPWQKAWTDSTKAFAHMYIDDAAFGAPLWQEDGDDRPYLDWRTVACMLYDKGILSKEQLKTIGEANGWTVDGMFCYYGEKAREFRSVGMILDDTTDKEVKS